MRKSLLAFVVAAVAVGLSSFLVGEALAGLGDGGTFSHTITIATASTPHDSCSEGDAVSDDSASGDDVPSVGEEPEGSDGGVVSAGEDPEDVEDAAAGDNATDFGDGDASEPDDIDDTIDDDEDSSDDDCESSD